MGIGCVRILANQSKPESWKQLQYDQSSGVEHFGTDPDVDPDPGIRTFLRAIFAFLYPGSEALSYTGM